MARQLIPGLESIDFNPRSTLGSDLEELFTRVIEDVRASPFGNTPNSYNRSKIRKSLESKWYRTGEYGAKLEKILQRNCNFAGVDHIDTYAETGPYCSMFGKIDMTDPRLNAIFNQMYMQGRLNFKEYVETGGKYSKLKLSHTKLIDAWRKIGESFDPKTGMFKLNELNYLDEARTSIRPAFGVPIEMLFLSEDEKPLTAREITAIYLHEIGHAVDTYVRIGNRCVINNLVLYNGKHAIEEVVSELPPPTEKELEGWKDLARNQLKKLEEYLAMRKDNVALSAVAKVAKIADAITGAISKIQNIFLSNDGVDRTEPQLSRFFGFMLVQVIVFLLKCFFIALSFPCIIFFMAIGNVMRAYGNIVDDIRMPGILHGNKINESTSSKYVLSTGERTADAFTVRFGFGADLATGLAKLAPHFYADSRFPSSGYAILDFIGTVLQESVRLLDFFRIFETAEDHVHNEGFRRIRFVMTECYAYFRLYKPNPDDPYAKHMAKEVEKLREVANSAKYAESRAAGNMFWKFVVGELLNPGHLIAMFISGHLDDDYTKMFEQVKNITDNNLHYWAYSLQSKTQQFDIDGSNFATPV